MKRVLSVVIAVAIFATTFFFCADRSEASTLDPDSAVSGLYFDYGDFVDTATATTKSTTFNVTLNYDHYFLGDVSEARSAGQYLYFCGWFGDDQSAGTPSKYGYSFDGGASFTWTTFGTTARTDVTAAYSNFTYARSVAYHIPAATFDYSNTLTLWVQYSNNTLRKIKTIAYNLDGSLIGNDGVLDIRSISGSSASAWNGIACSEYGYSDTYGIYFDNGDTYYLGNIDFSQFSQVKIIYATDPSSYLKNNESGTSSAFTLKNTATSHPGQNSDSEFNSDGLIAKADLRASFITDEDGENWDKSERIARIDLSEVDYNGPVYIQHYVPVNESCALIVGIEFTLNERNGIRGDLDKDGNVDAEDAMLAAKALLNSSLYSLNQDLDFNGDGVENSEDVSYLLMYTLLPDSYVLKGTVSSTYVQYVSRDQIQVDDECVGQNGSNPEITEINLGSYMDETANVYGWYASTSQPTAFGYSVDYGDIIYTTYELVEAESAVKTAAESVIGEGAYYTRFKISFPVDSGIHIVEFFAYDGQNHHIWTVDYTASKAPERLLAAAKEVADFCRLNGFTYGDATVNPGMNWADLDIDNPTYKYEYKFSCDRLVCWSLYRIGFTDQPYTQGLVVYDADGSNDLTTYCENWGFTRITDWASVEPGDIVFVGGSGLPQHTYIFAGWAGSVGGDGTIRYDGGSDWRIQQVQPYAQSVSVAGETFLYAMRPV